ncbi:MAG: ABC transporter ATP-binding protein [Nitrososphaerota archaeon]|jgi:oligopeptide/dipeptide ABC transporter ATP-binding protein|nr:ABC transporter ATP-binding protein [Nitrososphaerota archaeon]MCL5672790.1 ABC transporter ATP-binding protein [Nitrososphaerota archaeon]MDG6912199.1 ABC transporter ATP-binding protein [Nitrososphaerota archaeon]MDG6936970.1 ABC transporter ATP-binding protein [Nitrososphaerota archaeon]MDG6945415.1 ABC transporter ATP-binding protein [Nitrososphaerota archaeon]
MTETLAVSDLWVDYRTKSAWASAVRGVNLSVGAGEVIGVVGESGSGKSSLALAIIKLLPANARARGKVDVLGKDIVGLPSKDAHLYRGAGMTMIFQEPMTSLNPVMRVSDQLSEAVVSRREHHKLEMFRSDSVSVPRGPDPRFSMGPERRAPPSKEAVEALRQVRISDPERTAAKYPHELSGGERQRVMIAMSFLLRPRLLVADEPTTALDVTTQAQVLSLLLKLSRDEGTSIIFVSHDILVVGQVAQRVAVMYAGEVVELGPTEAVLHNPLHPYTRGLIGSIPGGFKGEKRIEQIPGSPPDIMKLPSGCKFNPRCKFAMDRCRVEETALKEMEKDHFVACHLY